MFVVSHLLVMEAADFFIRSVQNPRRQEKADMTFLQDGQEHGRLEAKAAAHPMFHRSKDSRTAEGNQSC
jgi:hypothetical protein